MSSFNVALCQFPVGRDIVANSQYIQGFLKSAKDENAQVVHFSECALSGYAGVDFPSFQGFDWQQLDKQTKIIQDLTAKLGLWVVLGTSHRERSQQRPYNSLYLLNRQGTIEARYDKRFCTPTDIYHYMPGDRFVVFDIEGVKCSLLICYDLRFPELYRELKKLEVECIFQSFYNAKQIKPSVHTHIMRQTMQANAATNYFWVSMTNSCAPICPYPSCFIQPDGKIAGELKSEKADMKVEKVDTSINFYDASAPYRDLAINGVLTNKSCVKDL